MLELSEHVTPTSGAIIGIDYTITYMLYLVRVIVEIVRKRNRVRIIVRVFVLLNAL